MQSSTTYFFMWKVTENIRLVLVKNKHSRELQHYSLVSIITEMLKFLLSTQKSLPYFLQIHKHLLFKSNY